MEGLKEGLNHSLFLSILAGFSPAELRGAHQKLGSFQSVVQESKNQLEAVVSSEALSKLARLRQSDGNTVDREARERADRLCDWCLESGTQVVDLDDEAYPELLREIADPPPILFVRGNLAALSLPQIAIVGSRSATPAGIDIAARFANHLGSGGFVITSGLATGIDSAAHRGALSANAKTLAVMGTGPDRVYPALNRALAEQIISHGGALVTEYFPGSGPRAHHFPRRNRIISGLSVATLVVEASERSGSLITARLAMEQGREVFAIPGSINNPQSRGCHRLIRDGAGLVESSEDVVAELASLIEIHTLRATGHDYARSDLAAEAETESLAGRSLELINLMGFDLISIDQLVELTGWHVSEIQSCLVELEIAGKVRSQGSHYQRLG